MDVATVAEPARSGTDAGTTTPRSSTEPEDSTLEGRWRTAAIAGVVLVVVAGLVLRFWTRSALWLDEALTVDIARHPLSQLHHLLRQDGAPPLYYLLLHLWMKAFGSSDLGARSLSGVISVLTIPAAWWAGRPLGRQSAWALLVLVAAAPFAIYYGTEARMYSLVMLLTALGIVALTRVMARPRPGNLIALGLVVAGLLYAQYWAIYLVTTLAVWLLWQGRKGQPDARRRTTARWSFGALAVGCLAFVPWLPTFFFQSRHTGTPWAVAGNFGAIVSALTGFTDNQATLSTVGSNQGRLLAVVYLILAFLAVFGVARDRWHIELDLHTRPRSRAVAFVVFATLVVAVGGGLLTKSGYSNRYAAVVFIPFLILVVMGVMTLRDARARAVGLALAAVAGLAVAGQNVTTQRTQASAVASVLTAQARPGDVVAFCPDQLGPAVYRFTEQSGYRQLTYPRYANPGIIDWIDYKAAIRRSSPSAFVSAVQAEAGSSHTIWLVWASGYQGYGTRCEQIATQLLDAPGYGGRTWVTQRATKYYEPMDLTQYVKLPTKQASTAGT
ncbi:MAG: glycosyltransferase family 39 protein [Acidimicrobiales bacterium]